MGLTLQTTGAPPGSALKKPCSSIGRKAMGTGGTLSHNRRQFSHQTKDLGRRKSDSHVRTFSDLESFCSVVSSDGKYFGEKRLWSLESPRTTALQETREVLWVHRLHREITLLSPSTLLWAQLPAWHQQCPQQPGAPGAAVPGDSNNPCPSQRSSHRGQPGPATRTHQPCRCH